MINKIINANPSPYPQTNTSEINAVTTLCHILDKGRIKPALNALDKIPNVDGHIEIVNENQQPLGKIEVQVKFLPSKKNDKPKHQCEIQFLAYCEDSILPVFLIVVEPTGEKAYWIHISKNYLKTITNKIKGKTVNIDLPIENIITKFDNSYIQTWINILNDYKTRIINFDVISDQLDDMKIAHKKLKKLTNPALGIDRDYFKEIHYFLDYYNNLLENDFFIIKEIFYEKCWKIGIAYSIYADLVLSYSLFPISHTTNDIQIKEINRDKEEKLKNIINYVSHNSTNPIKHQPIEYAYKYIIQDLRKIVDNRLLLPLNKYVANEYIIAFIDTYSEITGLESNLDIYKIEDVKFALNTFIPLICEEYLKDDNDPLHGIFNIDHLIFNVSPEEILKLVAIVNTRLLKFKNLSANNIDISATEISLQYLYELIYNLENSDEIIVSRIYPLKKYPQSDFYFNWQVYNEMDIKNIMDIIFKNLPKLYDHFVSEYFPQIKEQISFFSYFDRLIVNVEIKENTKDFKDQPGIELIYLKNLNSYDNNQTIDVHVGIDNIPLSLRDTYLLEDRIVTINDDKYKIIAASSSSLKNIFYEAPMQQYIYHTLQNRLEHYLEPFHNGSSTLFKFTSY